MAGVVARGLPQPARLSAGSFHSAPQGVRRDLVRCAVGAPLVLYKVTPNTQNAKYSLAKGEEVKPLRTVKELSYAVGQILGLPTRNVYNIIYGLTKRISPSTAYGWDSNLYNKNYSTDLQKAIDNDDDDMLATIVGLMLFKKFYKNFLKKFKKITCKRLTN